jgi:hypothetical protein
MFYFFVFILIASLSFSCNAEQNTMEIIDSTDSLSIVMNEWKDWAESSADGLWENDSSHMVTLDLLHVYGGPEEVDPPFFYPEAFTVQGDTFFVSDGGAQKLVVFNSQGEILWSTEGPGEGPGLFSGVSQLDVVGDIISVSNLGNSRIDLFQLVSCHCCIVGYSFLSLILASLVVNLQFIGPAIEFRLSCQAETSFLNVS